jgi:outer membrane protein TolC
MGQVQEDYFDPLTDDITDYLPPLEALLDSAVRNSPEVKYEQLKTDYYRYEVRSAQVAFLEHFYAEPEVNYGQYYFDDYITSRTTSAQASYPYTESNRWNFNFAFSIRFPLTSIVDRRNRINKQKKWVEISMAQQEINKRIIRQEVITLYNTIVQQQRQLKIHNDYQHFTNIQMMMAENEFVNGQISTAEITRLKEIQTRGATEFEKTRAEFENAYDLLQEKTGMRFNKIKGID